MQNATSLLLGLGVIAFGLPAHAEQSGMIDLTIGETVASVPTDAAPEPANNGTMIVLEPQVAAPAPAVESPQPQASTTAPTQTQPVDEAALFANGSDSLVARTVGHAEGTRGADGGKNQAYYGHTDPGNGAHNIGSFSYQHGARSPEEADVKQLQTLRAQARQLQQKAASLKFQMTLEEELNGIDLANQSPLAALDNPGYADWLQKAHDKGLSGADAVLWARTQSYWNPRQSRWEAPGLGNSEGNISHDQNRRMTAIARAQEIYQSQTQRLDTSKLRAQATSSQPTQTESLDFTFLNPT